MMTKRWQRDHKNDPYYKKAKAEGYRSRAAYKLKQINDKYHVIHRGDIVLDLGAAPGGWSQVAKELVGKKGQIVGLDLKRIKPLSDVVFLVGDISDEDIIEQIQENIDTNHVDVIISDAAPNISGNYSVDQARSIFLAETAFNLCQKILGPTGNFVVKVFEGEDFKQFYDEIKNSFKTSHLFSPKASRASTSEIYVIGLGYKV
jgi:23S rRNA (uridine2552-2'-O)-methyltransferase